MGTKEVSKTLRRNRENRYMQSTESKYNFVVLKRKIKENKTKLSLKKYDPILRKRVIFKEVRIPKERKKR